MYHQPLIISASNASQLCYNALEHFLSPDPSDWQQVAPRGMTVRERLAVTYRLDNALECIAWLGKRRLSYPFMAAEFCWISFGRRDVASISNFCPNIAQFSDDGLTFFGAYGPPFVRQLPYVVDALRADPHSRQAVGIIWREVPPKTKDVPCTVGFQFFVRNGEVHGIFTMRSSDAWLGLPYDTFNFARLTAVVAGLLELPPGSLTINVGSAHLYQRDWVRAGEVVQTKDVRVLAAKPLNALTFEHGAALNAALDGKANDWPSGFREEDAGWYELFSVLRFARHRDPRLIYGDFATAFEWNHAEAEPVAAVAGESHGRPS